MDKLTEAISRLNEAEYQLSHDVRNAEGNLKLHLREIETEVRRARMRVEEFKEAADGAAETQP